MTPRPNIRRYLLVTGALTVLGALCVVLVIYLLSWQDKDDGIVTAKQCTDTDTAASIERLEEGDVIKEDLTQTPVTEEMCGEINDRALLVGTNPVARAIEVERVVQEFRIIQDSIRAADENQSASRPPNSSPPFSGVVANSPSGRPETVKMSPLSFSMAQNNWDESRVNGSSAQPGQRQGPSGPVEEEQQQVPSGSAPGDPEPGDPPPPPPPPPAPSGAGEGSSGAIHSISSDAREAVKDGASPKEAVAEAQAAGENAGASKAAAAGAKNAVSLALIDGTMTNGVVKGNVAYTTPPQEMRWKDSTDMELVLSPSTSNSIEELKQKIKEVKEAGEVTVEPVDVSQRMEAVVFSTPDPAFDVNAITGESQQLIISEGDTEWRWKIIASNTGDKDLYLNLSVGLSSPQEGETYSFRPAEGFPVSFEKISVKGTPWQNASNFVGSNWLWLWTAILIPLVAFLWGRRKKPSKSEDKGFVGSSWQWLRMTIIVPVAAFLRGRRKQSDKNKDIE
jgi:hypothetical protein